MHDIFGAILELVADAAPSAELPDRPRWLRWGCIIFSIGPFVLIVALIVCLR